MILYGLRLLVALLTFAVGIAAAWLFHPKSPEAYESRDGATGLAVLMPVEPGRSCRLEELRKTGPAVFSGILQSKTIDESSPAYPHYAKVARVSGKVVVKVEVDEDGRVSKAHAQGGFGMLPEAAEKDALETRVTPTWVEGRPVKATGYIMYNYVLD
jgi:TonB family protein